MGRDLPSYRVLAALGVSPSEAAKMRGAKKATVQFHLKKERKALASGETLPKELLDAGRLFVGAFRAAEKKASRKAWLAKEATRRENIQTKAKQQPCTNKPLQADNQVIDPVKPIKPAIDQDAAKGQEHENSPPSCKKNAKLAV